MMSTIIRPCSVCQAPAILRCSGCHSNYYCGNVHQKLDWSKHRQACCAYEIRITPALGRHLVATKDLKEGDVIMRQNPSVMGPMDLSSLYNCVGCYRVLKQVKSFCPRCNLPACKKTCSGLADPAGHFLECALFKTGVIPRSDIAWPGITFLLRCLLLRRANPNMWQVIQERAPYAEAKRVTKISETMVVMLAMMKPMLVKFSAIAPDLLPDVSGETLTKIIDVLDAHSFDISLNADDKIGALYPIASLLQTSCAPNTRLSFVIETTAKVAAGEKMGAVTVTAARNIAQGEILTWTSIPTTMSTLARQGFLCENRNMRCHCARCLDPSELGSNFGTIKCIACSGWILPVSTTNIVASPWKCYGKCGMTLSKDEAASRQVILQKELSEILSKKLPLPALEALLIKFGKNFHPNSWCSMNLKRVMMKAYSIPPALSASKKHISACLETFGIGRNPLDRISDFQLERKAELCRDLLNILDLVFAGVHPEDLLSTADILLNLAVAEGETLKRKITTKGMDQNEATSIIVNCLRLLTRAEKLVHLRGTIDSPKRRGTLAEDISKEMSILLAWSATNGLIGMGGPPAKIPKLSPRQ